MKKRAIYIGIIIGTMILCVFTKTNWSMLKLKYGMDSLVIWPPDIYVKYNEDYDVYKQLLIEVNPKKISELNVSLTDIVYIPKLKQISFGILYRNNDYDKSDVPLSIFHVYLKDEEGNVYNRESFTFTSGTFETFQRRCIYDIDISNIEELTMYICPLKIEESKIVEKKGIKKLVYTKKIESLEEIKD